jgi:hypothetical protein
VEHDTVAKAPQIGETAFQVFMSLKDHFGITELEGVEEGNLISKARG